MIRFQDGTEFEPVEIRGVKRDLYGANRDTLTMKFDGVTASELAAVFTEGAIYEVDNGEIDEQGNPITYDKSDYCLTGDLIDHRDGTVTVIMAKRTDAEINIESQINALLSIIEGAGGE